MLTTKHYLRITLLSQRRFARNSGRKFCPRMQKLGRLCLIKSSLLLNYGWIRELARWSKRILCPDFDRLATRGGKMIKGLSRNGPLGLFAHRLCPFWSGKGPVGFSRELREWFPEFQMNKNEIEICEFEMRLNTFFVCALIWVTLWHNFCLKARRKTGMDFRGLVWKRVWKITCFGLK